MNRVRARLSSMLALTALFGCAHRATANTQRTSAAISPRENPSESSSIRRSYCEDGVCDTAESPTSCPWDCQPELGRVPAPELRPAIAIEDMQGGFHQYFADAPSETGEWRFDDATATIRLRHDGQGHWSAEFTAHREIKAVSFPWMPRPYTPTGETAEPSRVYYPFIGGLVERDGDRPPFHWWGLAYPGEAFAPLVIQAHRTRARIVAATNWPLRRVRVFFAHRQVQHWYDQLHARPGTTRTLHAMVLEVHGDDLHGYAPWALALERYARWLRSYDRTLEDAPSWMQRAEGFFMNGLQNMYVFDADALRTRWQRWREVFPWVQFWGQMSHYAGDPAIAQPPRDPNEPVGCCLENVGLHPRYGAPLERLVRDIAASGDHVGFYAAPSAGALDTVYGAQVLRRWLDAHRARGANAFYVDVLGRGYFGDPSLVRLRFDDGTVPSEAMIEGFVDAYPRVPLLSGMLNGGHAFSEARPDEASCAHCTYPAMARWLMGARPGFSGVSNGDHTRFGPRANPPFDGERALFLLGIKYELDMPEVSEPVLREVFAAHRAVRFFARNPRYRHTLGLSDFSPGITVRRFDTGDDAVLLAVDNPQHIEGASVRLRGQLVPLPARALSMIEVPGTHAAH